MEPFLLPSKFRKVYPIPGISLLGYKSAKPRDSRIGQWAINDLPQKVLSV